MEVEDISYKLRITEKEKIVAEQPVTVAGYLPRVGEIITVCPYEGPLDDFIENIRKKEERNAKCDLWSPTSYALLRFQQEFTGDYQVIKVQHTLNLFGTSGLSLWAKLSTIENNEKKIKLKIESKELPPNAKYRTIRYGLENAPEHYVELRSSDVPLVVVSRLYAKIE